MRALFLLSLPAILSLVPAFHGQGAANKWQPPSGKICAIGRRYSNKANQMKTHPVLVNFTLIVDVIFFVIFMILLWIAFAH
jgi:hypothetical protein